MTPRFELKTNKFKSCNPLFNVCHANHFDLDLLQKPLSVVYIPFRALTPNNGFKGITFIGKLTTYMNNMGNYGAILSG